MDEKDRRPGEPPTGTASESLNSSPNISQIPESPSCSVVTGNGRVVAEMTVEEADEYFRNLVILITHRGVEH